MRTTTHAIQQSPSRRAHRVRRGVATLLSLLVVTVMAVLALGYYSSSTMSMQIAANQQSAGRAAHAAYSGMEFMRLQLATISVPHGTSDNALLTEVFADLQSQLNGTATLSGRSIGSDSSTIYIPTGGAYCALGDGTGFRAAVSHSGTNLDVHVIGIESATGITREIKMTFAIATRASRIFDYGVASKSKVSMNGNAKIRGTLGNAGNGSVLTTTMSTPTPFSMIGSASISGDLSTVNPDPNAISVSSSGTIAGYGPNHSLFAQHVHTGVEAPEFPTVDNSVYEPYATNLITSGNPSGKYFKNIRIKANTNPSFQAQTVLDGVVFIELPNNVRFGGGATINGVVAVQTNSLFNANLNPASSLIEFTGGVTVNPLSSLPATTDFPAAMRALSGAFLLAPGATASFKGNFNTVGGTIIASQLSFTGNSGGTVNGSVINLNDTLVDLAGSTDIIIVSQGTREYPSGVYFGSRFSPLADTYREVNE